MAEAIEKGVPVDKSVEPVREVLRRIWLGGFSTSFRVEQDDKLIEAAKKLAREGWLVDDDRYQHFGTRYHRFKVGPRLDVKALKDI